MRECTRTLLCFAWIAMMAWLGGCSPVQQQGWIGGDFKQAGRGKPPAIRALPSTIAKNQKGAVFVSRVFENTPLSTSQIQPGDLIVSLDGEPVQSLKAFRHEINTTEPGESLRATVYRNGRLYDHEIIVGQEVFGEKKGVLGIGIPLEPRIDLFPDSDFSIFGLIGYRLWDHNMDMASPEYVYAAQADQAQGAAASVGWAIHMGPVWLSCRRYAEEQRCFPNDEVR